MTRQEYEAKRDGLLKEASALIDSGSLEAAEGKMGEVTALDEAFENEAKARANLEAMSKPPRGLNGFGEGAFTGGGNLEEKEDIYNSVEYRKAFMAYVTNGTAIPEKFKNVNETTKTTDVGAIISPMILKKIVEKLEASGMILPLVTKTAFPAGVTIPTSSVKPVATWVAEGGTSNKQKKSLGQIDIKGYKLRCSISMTLETSVMSLEFFEGIFVNSVTQAMVKTLEISFISGTGSAQPKGVLTETVVSGQNVEIAADGDPDYKTLVAAEAALPLAYEANAVWNMTKKTFMKFVGMVDSNGQPIARTNYGIDGKPERILLGRRVVLNEYMVSLGATITKDEVVAFLYDWSDYMFNTNYAMTVKRYEDNDTEDQITKAIMICDGKPLDVNSLVTVTKKYQAAD